MSDEIDRASDTKVTTDEPVVDEKAGPVFNVPSVLLSFVIVLLVIHAARTYLVSPSLDEEILMQFAFVPARYLDFVQLGDYGWLWTFLTYSLLHGSWQHVIFNAIWMVVFGTPVAERLGVWRALIFFITASSAAVLGFMAIYANEVIFLIGASGIVSGLTGAACRFALGHGLSSQNRTTASMEPQMSIVEALTNRSVLFFMVFWFVANVVLGAGASYFDPQSAPVAWEAHIAGFLFGFLVFPLFDPTPKGTIEEQA